jgi:hypothetical protein
LLATQTIQKNNVNHVRWNLDTMYVKLSHSTDRNDTDRYKKDNLISRSVELVVVPTTKTIKTI